MKSWGQYALVACAVVCASGLGLGCLDQDAEHPGYSPHLRAADADVPPVEEDERLRKRIDSRDNVEGMQVVLRTGFSEGHPVHYFDFGTTDSMAAGKPQWVFRQRGADGMPEDFGHLDLIDSVPGDTGYSPLRTLYLVMVTRRYKGERITSLDALEDAQEIGLVEEPVALGSYGACPVVLADTTLEPSPGAPPPLAARKVYYRGHIASCFAALDAEGKEALAFDMRGMIPSANAYSLRRQNETRALDEALWMADLNADGDMVDSNLVFATPAAGGVSFRIFDVIVAPDYEFGDSQAESDLFERQMMSLKALEGVIAYTDSATQRLISMWSDAP